MKRNGAAHRGGRASVRWQGEAGVAAFRQWRMALEGGGSPASTLQVGEMMGQVRGGLSGKSEEGCVRAVVLTGDGGDGGAARGRGRGELSAGIDRRNSEDGSGRQGAAALVSARRSRRKRLDVAATQDEASPLEHGTRDVRPGRSQTQS
jgi:hypothetical protein